MRYSRWTPSLLALASICCLAVGCAGPKEPGATTDVSDEEIAGMHSPNDLDPITAQRFVDHVRLGTGVDSDSAVPEDLISDSFAENETIYLSMEVTDAPAGSLVRVAVYSQDGNEAVWVDENEVPPGPAHLSFVLEGSALTGGLHRASVTIGDEVVAEKEFEIVEQTS